MTYSRRRTASRYATMARSAYGVGRQVYRGVKAVNRLRTATKRITREAPSYTVTQQRDVKTQYRKRKRISGKQRKFQKFAKKVKKAINSKTPLTSYFESNGVVQKVFSTLSTLGTQFQFPFVSSDLGARDLRLMEYSQVKGFGTVLQGLNNVTIDNADSVVIRSTDIADWNFTMNAIMQITIKNVYPAQAPGEPAVIMVDVYECVAAQDMGPNNIHRTAYSSWTNNLSTNQQIRGIGMGVPVPEYSGCTPWDAPEFGQYWKVLNKQRIELGPGQLASTTLKTGFKKISFAKWSGKEVKRGVTKDVLIVACPVRGGDIQSSTDILEIDFTKNYHMRVPDINVGVQSNWVGHKFIL